MDVQQVRRGLRRQGASQRSLEEYMSGYDTQVPFHLQNIHKQSFQSDAEFFGDVRPITSNLPNAAPAPFVYLGFCCAVLAGLCFTSRFLPNFCLFILPLSAM